MIELTENKLIIRRPDIHQHAVCEVDFQRTLRIPDDNQSYPLPPGLGRFPLEHVEDHADRLPSQWRKHGGVLLPMYQAEALWVNFNLPKHPDAIVDSYPFALKIATGKVNAVSGKLWSEIPESDPQDYVVLPSQQWLDGYCVQKGLIRQFVSMPLGSEFTAEEQITGEAVYGGIQIIAYPMKREWYEKLEQEAKQSRIDSDDFCVEFMAEAQCVGLGLAAGGLMRQEIYEDEYGIDAWDTTNPSRCFVHILNSEQWKSSTGKSMPTTPLSASDYTDAGLPWFEVDSGDTPNLEGSEILRELDSVATKEIKFGKKVLAENKPLKPSNVFLCTSNRVIDGAW